MYLELVAADELFRRLDDGHGRVAGVGGGVARHELGHHDWTRRLDAHATVQRTTDAVTRQADCHLLTNKTRLTDCHLPTNPKG